MTPICDTGLRTETFAGTPCGVGSAGGLSRTVRSTTLWADTNVGETARRSTWAATEPTCHSWASVTQTDDGSRPWPADVARDLRTER